MVVIVSNTDRGRCDSNDTKISFSHRAMRDDFHPGRIMLDTDVVAARIYSRGYVKLRSTDPFDQLVVNPRNLSQVEDRNNVIHGLKFLFALFKSETYKQVNARTLIDVRNILVIFGCLVILL